MSSSIFLENRQIKMIQFKTKIDIVFKYTKKKLKLSLTQLLKKKEYHCFDFLVSFTIETTKRCAMIF